MFRFLHGCIIAVGHNYIGSEHLLLGLLREGEGVAARVLENLGADPSNIRTQVRSAVLFLATFFAAYTSISNTVKPFVCNK